MRTLIINVILCSLVIATLAIDEHRPKKKAEDRGKRNLEYQISHHYSAIPTYRLERRIATGSQYQNPQFYSRSYHKGRPQSYPVPPYAVQMEPLVHYSQRDPLYDTNILSLDPHNEDLLTENNHIQENVDRYGYQKPHIIERPVYIKEPEPIIEIIIKESNVSLPAPPPPPPPPKKKKEQVQVFYVKYTKNPHGSGKDSIIYDKPVPAISPHIPDDEEPEEEPAPYYPEAATVPPPPSTTLRTFIKPDSEVYHSPSGVKVTFGKEGFDYDKRSSKPEDYVPLQTAAPQGRQLTSFSNAYFKSPSSGNFQSVPPGFSSNVRQVQPYRTINLPPSNYKSFGRQTAPPQIQQTQNYPFQIPAPGPQFSGFSQPTSPQFDHSVSHPPPPRFQSSSKPNIPQNRQPVPYKPFDNLRPAQTFSQPPVQHQPIQFRPETHFPLQQQLPLPEDTRNFNPPRFNQYNSGEIPSRQTILQHQSPQHYQQLPNIQAQANFRQPNLPQHQPQFPQHFQQQPLPDHQQNFRRPQQNIPQHQQAFQHQNSPPPSPPSQFQHPQLNSAQQFRPPQQQNIPQQQNFQHQQNVPPRQNIQPQQNSSPQQNAFKLQKEQQQHNFNNQQSQLQNEHFKNIQSAQNILPPGGQLIPSVSKYESHISSIEPAPKQSLSPQQYQQKIIQQFNQNGLSQEQSSQELLSRQQSSAQDSSHELLTRQQSGIQQHNNQELFIRQQNAIQQHNNEELLNRQQNNIQQQKKLLQEIQRGKDRQNYIQNYFPKTNAEEFVNSQQNTIHQQKQLFDDIERQRQQQEQLRQFYQQNPDIQQAGIGNTRSESQSTSGREYQVGRNRAEGNAVPKEIYRTSTSEATTTTTSKPTTTTKDPKILEAQLPDEVPEELREQLLSSGILNHADISVLDYDKVGDIPLSALPPEQLANFYGAGGASQLGAASDPVPSVVRKDGTRVENHVEFDAEEPQSAASELVQKVVASPLTAEPSGVEMKVVRYDPGTDKGQQVQEKYVEEEAHQVNPVVLNDNSYNRYLPLKINGTQFPIPDVPELRGKSISSVVVLAPISYDFSTERKTRETTRELSKKSNDIELIDGTALKELLTDPSLDNFKRFLETENRTSSDKQAVILLVADSASPKKEQEIYMYDVATQTVSKLNGELSSAFVEAAEANSNDKNVEEASASNILERTAPYSGQTDRQDGIYENEYLEQARSESLESKVPIIDPLQDEDMETQASQHLETFVDISGHPAEDLSFSSSRSNSVNNRIS